ncbi:hypothetical protein ABZ362_30850, partial [Streptomyces sp. NPDC005951]|uniref:ParA family protein n=1 Tax=Streptomyces sp. NPDC005951 TaxID=3154573 RepID=UPI0033D53E6B
MSHAVPSPPAPPGSPPPGPGRGGRPEPYRPPVRRRRRPGHRGTRAVRIKETALERVLAEVEQDFDFIVIDCP